MSERPAYFDRIRLKAERDWNDMERGQWCGAVLNTFEGIQRPRQVVSELLQNAADANATKAGVRVDDGSFVFMHDGDDFTAENFESLCSFGNSNKRKLYNIGFRGIGFKSTFSLGDRVEVFTPTISVAFRKERFTVPEWVGSSKDIKDAGASDRSSAIRPTRTPLQRDGFTHIRVKFGDQMLQRTLKDHLREWVDRPVPLLFLEGIRSLTVQDKEIVWECRGGGPIPGSRRYGLRGRGKQVLLLQANREEFPDDALEEIRKVRRLGDEKMKFPPCTVDAALVGDSPSIQSPDASSLYAILPTAVKTGLPFACNAPFVQDPDRRMIKDPALSPTNRWLLERIGKLAASAMLDWLGREGLPLDERARAYDLLPDYKMRGSSLDRACGKMVRDAFAEVIEGQDIFLTEDGRLVSSGKCTIVPAPFLDVWSMDQIARLMDTRERTAFCSSVGEQSRKRLVRWGVVGEITEYDLRAALRKKHPPKPEWGRLLSLWSHLESLNNYFESRAHNIVPVQGKEKLYAANEVVRLGKELLPGDDLEFLTGHLLVLDPDWLRFLEKEKQSQAAPGRGDPPAGSKADIARDVLRRLTLDKTSDAKEVIDQAAKSIFGEMPESKPADCIRLAQIAAKLEARVGGEFLYVAQDLKSRSGKAVLFDRDGNLKDLLPESLRRPHLLHDDYKKSFASCTQSEWNRWIDSGCAGIRTFVPAEKKYIHYNSREGIEREAAGRGLRENLSYPYNTEEFILEDWDFEERYWSHWEKAAGSDDMLWVKLARLLLKQNDAYWKDAKGAKLLQVSSKGNKRTLTGRYVPSGLVLRLRELPCLTSREDKPARPVDLFRLTPKTAPLIGTEQFVDQEWEAMHPMLDLLGVKSTPAGPDQLLERLRTLAAGEPPIHEVEDVYRNLDQMFNDSCSESEQKGIKEVLGSERLIRSQDGAWNTVSAVFIVGEEDVPDAPAIMASVSDLPLWKKIGVNDRPTADRGWLKDLQPGTTQSKDELGRIKRLLVRYPADIYKECGCWLNLESEWTPVGSLSYAITDQSRLKRKMFHQWVRKRTADLRGLGREDAREFTTSKLTPLEECIEYRLAKNVQPVERHGGGGWLRTFGAEMSRVRWDNEEDAKSIRANAKLLSEAEWLEATDLKVTPHVDGRPAGDERNVDVKWDDGKVYVDKGLPDAKLAQSVPDEIGKVFSSYDEIKAALCYSFGRTDKEIREYLDANFSLESKDDHSHICRYPPPDPATEPKTRGDGPPIRPTRPPPRGGNGTGADKLEIAARARKIVMDKEKEMGHEPTDRESEKLGYDIKSRIPDTGQIRYIEVKGREEDATSITVTRGEILHSLKHPNNSILAIVRFRKSGGSEVHYVRNPFQSNLTSDIVTSVNYNLGKLLDRGRPLR